MTCSSRRRVVALLSVALGLNLAGIFGCGPGEGSTKPGSAPPATEAPKPQYTYDFDWWKADAGGGPAPADAIVPVEDAGSDPEQPACSTDADCVESMADTAGPCETLRCVDGVCTAESFRGADCCVVAMDCDDGNPATMDTCPKVGAACSNTGNPSKCAVDEVQLSCTFEDGSPQGWVAIDQDPSDETAWFVTSERAAEGAFSAHLTVGPSPSGTSSAAALRSPKLNIPPAVAAHALFRVWLDLEPGVPTAGPLCSDVSAGMPCYSPEAADKVGDRLTLTVLDPSTPDIETGGWARTVVWSAAGMKKTTAGEFADVAVDLSAWSGRGIVLELRGEHGSIQGGMPREGAYVDAIRVGTTCKVASCTKAADCAAGSSCAEARCALLGGAGKKGLCRVDVAPDCFKCKSPTDCNDSNSCTTDTCAQGQCVWDTTCCDDGVTLGPLGFDAPALPPGWVTSASVADVGWRVAALDPHSGSGHLYFGRADAASYDSHDYGEAGRAYGWLETPPVAIPSAMGASIATFALRLDTEWIEGGWPSDGATVDRFTLGVIADGMGEVTVFDSYDFGGATLTELGQTGYWNALADLTPWAGQVVRLRFSFDTGDALSNAYEGVFIDDLAIRTTCAWPETPCTVDGHCVDDDPCTPDVCWLGVCSMPPIHATCCSTTADCAGNNPCIEWACAQGECQGNGLASPQCCDDSLQWLSDFEAVPGEDWTFQSTSFAVAWHWASGSAGAHSGMGALRFGNPSAVSYDDPTTGVVVARATTPPRWILGTGEAQLAFWLELSTEHDAGSPGLDGLLVDRLAVYVVEDGGAPKLVWESLAIGGSTHGAWEPITIGLAGYEGKRVRFLFEFDTGDDQNNGFDGARIDDLRIETTCPAWK